MNVHHLFWSEKAVEISILARLFWLRVQIIYMPFLVRTDKEIISNSKFTRLTIEKTLSFIWHLFHLGKWRQWGKKIRTKQLIAWQNIAIKSLIFGQMNDNVSKRLCLQVCGPIQRDCQTDKRSDLCPLFWKITGIKSTLSLNSCPSFHSHQHYFEVVHVLFGSAMATYARSARGFLEPGESLLRLLEKLGKGKGCESFWGVT